MRFFINLGVNKNKDNHIKNINGKKVMTFNMVLEENTKRENREYHYLKCETWNEDVINVLEEKKSFELDRFKITFFKNHEGEKVIKLIIFSLKGLEAPKKVQEDKKLDLDLDFDFDFLEEEK